MTDCRKCQRFGDCCFDNNDGYNCIGFEPKTMTNADRVRSMTDEELAEFFVNAYWHICKSGEDIPIDPETEECMGSCKQCNLDWLKRKAEV